MYALEHSGNSCLTSLHVVTFHADLVTSALRCGCVLWEITNPVHSLNSVGGTPANLVDKSTLFLRHPQQPRVYAA